jgi:hypothetical protein
VISRGWAAKWSESWPFWRELYVAQTLG